MIQNKKLLSPLFETASNCPTISSGNFSPTKKTTSGDSCEGRAPFLCTGRLQEARSGDKELRNPDTCWQQLPHTSLHPWISSWHTCLDGTGRHVKQQEEGAASNSFTSTNQVPGNPSLKAWRDTTARCCTSMQMPWKWWVGGKLDFILTMPLIIIFLKSNKITHEEYLCPPSMACFHPTHPPKYKIKQKIA